MPKLALDTVAICERCFQTGALVGGFGHGVPAPGCRPPNMGRSQSAGQRQLPPCPYGSGCGLARFVRQRGYLV